MNGYSSAHAAYTESSVLTAPPDRLVVMLYEGAIRFLNQAAAAMRAGDRTRSSERMRRAHAIIDELNGTLDMTQGEVSARLRSIYLFSKRQLLEALLHDDSDAVQVVVRLLDSLLESWRRVGVGAPVAA